MQNKLPLTTFESESAKNLFRIMYKKFDVNEATIESILPSQRTLKRAAIDLSAKTENLIKSKAPKLALEGRLSIALDHKSVGATTGDDETKALGIQLSITDDKFRKKHYLLSFRATNTSAKTETLRLAREILTVNYLNFKLKRFMCHFHTGSSITYG